MPIGDDRKVHPPRLPEGRGYRRSLQRALAPTNTRGEKTRAEIDLARYQSGIAVL